MLSSFLLPARTMLADAACGGKPGAAAAFRDSLM
jgi:hypothetical protein